MYVLDTRGHHQQISPPSQSQDVPSQPNSSSSPRYSIKSTTSTSTSVDATDQDLLILLPKKDMFPVTPTAEQVMSASPDNVSMHYSIVIYCYNIYIYLPVLILI